MASQAESEMTSGMSSGGAGIGSGSLASAPGKILPVLFVLAVSGYYILNSDDSPLKASSPESGIDDPAPATEGSQGGATDETKRPLSSSHNARLQPPDNRSLLLRYLSGSTTGGATGLKNGSHNAEHATSPHKPATLISSDAPEVDENADVVSAIARRPSDGATNGGRGGGGPPGYWAWTSRLTGRGGGGRGGGRGGGGVGTSGRNSDSSGVSSAPGSIEIEGDGDGVGAVSTGWVHGKAAETNGILRGCRDPVREFPPHLRSR